MNPIEAWTEIRYYFRRQTPPFYSLENCLPLVLGKLVLKYLQTHNRPRKTICLILHESYIQLVSTLLIHWRYFCCNSKFQSNLTFTASHVVLPEVCERQRPQCDGLLSLKQLGKCNQLTWQSREREVRNKQKVAQKQTRCCSVFGLSAGKTATTVQWSGIFKTAP